MDNFVYIPTAKGLAQLPPPTQPQAQPLASTLTPTALTRSETVGRGGSREVGQDNAIVHATCH